jgi:hypothetical protein
MPGFDPAIDLQYVLKRHVLRLNLFFFILVCEAIGTAATPGLLCQPRVIVKMIMGKQMECRLAGETEVLGKRPAPAPLLSITNCVVTRYVMLNVLTSFNSKSK